MPTMTHDVFLSHSSADKVAVEEIAHKLVDAGLKPWLDKWDVVPGTLWQTALAIGVTDSRCAAVFVGLSGIGPWEDAEMMVALNRAFRDRTYRVIPVLLPGAPDSSQLKLPGFLNLFSWVDFRAGLDDSEGLRRLIAGIRGVPPGSRGSVDTQDGVLEEHGFKLPKLPNWQFDARTSALEFIQHIKQVLDVRVKALSRKGIDVQKMADSPTEQRYKFVIPGGKEYWFSVVFDQGFGPDTLAFLDFWGTGQWRSDGATAIGKMEWDREKQRAALSLTNFSLLDPAKGTTRRMTKEELSEEIWKKICTTLEQLS